MMRCDGSWSVVVAVGGGEEWLEAGCIFEVRVGRIC